MSRFRHGIALTVLISQLPKLFGFSIESDGPLRNIVAIGEGVIGGKVNWVALAVGAATLAVILLLKGSKRIPGILIAVVGATLVVALLDLGQAHAGKKAGRQQGHQRNCHENDQASTDSHLLPRGFAL